MSVFDDAAGVVLAGGQSKRMGKDKSSLPWGDSTLQQKAVEFLLTMFPQAVVVLNRDNGVPSAGAKIVFDSVPDQGPLRGLEAALEAVSLPWVFVMAVDMPFATRECVDFLSAQRRGHDVVMFKKEGRLEPLFAFYSRECLIAVRQKLEAKERKIISLLPLVNAKLIEVGPESTPPGIAQCLRNINTPQDLAQAQGAG